MNNRVITLIGLAICSVYSSVAFCDPISPEEALYRVSDSCGGIRVASHGFNRSNSFNLNSELIYTSEENGIPTIYLFNSGDELICLSADDDVSALLGYSDNFASPDKFPSAFVGWLNTISKEISLIRAGKEGRDESEGRDEDFEPIEPLCKTKWNQNAPYNLTCPTMSGDNKRCYTGCVATAMAQVMRYHGWPEVGEGRISYRWEYGNSNLQALFSKQKFDWANMLDEYLEGEYTDEEAVAVASLMRNCGISVRMNYSTSASGAMSQYIAGALGEFFKYDKSKIRYVMRDYYSLVDWEEMIYNSLKNDGPVILDGQSNQGGHSFVCDGYDKDGYFHINWGWGGISDGYYLLSVLDPYNQGIGGSGDNSGFNFMQDAIIGITPAKGSNPDDAWYTQIYGYGEIGLDTSLEYAPGDGVGPLCEDGVYNFGPRALPADTSLGILFREDKEEEEAAQEYVWGIVIDENIDILYGFSDFSLPLPEELPDGTYNVTLSYQAPSLNWGKWMDVLFNEDTVSSYKATVSDGVIRFEDSNWRPSGVGEIEQIDLVEPVRYFNLQGMPISEPAKGSIVIVKEGKKSYKQIFNSVE